MPVSFSYPKDQCFSFFKMTSRFCSQPVLLPKRPVSFCYTKCPYLPYTLRTSPFFSSTVQSLYSQNAQYISSTRRTSIFLLRKRPVPFFYPNDHYRLFSDFVIAKRPLISPTQLTNTFLLPTGRVFIFYPMNSNFVLRLFFFPKCQFISLPKGPVPSFYAEDQYLPSSICLQTVLLPKGPVPFLLKVLVPFFDPKDQCRLFSDWSSTENDQHHLFSNSSSTQMTSTICSQTGLLPKWPAAFVHRLFCYP